MSEADRLCTCGHNIYAHDDMDGDTHECQLCECEQFVDVKDDDDVVDVKDDDGDDA